MYIYFQVNQENIMARLDMLIINFNLLHHQPQMLGLAYLVIPLP